MFRLQTPASQLIPTTPLLKCTPAHITHHLTSNRLTLLKFQLLKNGILYSRLLIHMHMTQQRYHITSQAQHAVHYKHPNSLHSLCTRERLQQNKCDKPGFLQRAFHESKLKQVLPTGALELIQPIFAAACRTFSECNLSNFLPNFLV